MKISQSLVKELIKFDTCYHKIQLGYIDKVQTLPTDSMLNGLYFEHHLIGGTRDGKEPVLPLAKSGAKLKRQTDLDDLLVMAKEVMQALRIEMLEVQPYYESETLSGHIDLIANVCGEKAIIDVKWTGLDLANKWNGWTDIHKQYADNKINVPDKLIQPLHYVELMKQCTGEEMPFYYLVFNKSGGCKFIQVQISEGTQKQYADILENISAEIFDAQINGFKAMPELNKCRACFYKAHCKNVSKLPHTEEIII